MDEYCCDLTKEENAGKAAKSDKSGKKISKFEQMSNMRCGVENGRPLLTYRDGSTGSDLKRFEKELAYEKRRFESHWKRVIKKGERKITALEAEQQRMEKEARSQSKHSESYCSDVSTNTDEGVPNVCEVSLTDTFSGSVHSSLWVRTIFEKENPMPWPRQPVLKNRLKDRFKRQSWAKKLDQFFHGRFFDRKGELAFRQDMNPKQILVLFENLSEVLFPVFRPCSSLLSENGL